MAGKFKMELYSRELTLCFRVPPEIRDKLETAITTFDLNSHDTARNIFIKFTYIVDDYQLAEVSCNDSDEKKVLEFLEKFCDENDCTFENINE